MVETSLDEFSLIFRFRSDPQPFRQSKKKSRFPLANNGWDRNDGAADFDWFYTTRLSSRRRRRVSRTLPYRPNVQRDSKTFVRLRKVVLIRKKKKWEKLSKMQFAFVRQSTTNKQNVCGKWNFSGVHGGRLPLQSRFPVIAACTFVFFSRHGQRVRNSDRTHFCATFGRSSRRRTNTNFRDRISHYIYFATSEV